MARVRICNSVKIETGQHLLPVLKIVTCTALVACVYMEAIVYSSELFQNLGYYGLVRVRLVLGQWRICTSSRV